MSATGLSDDQLQELLQLTAGSDSVELKLTVPEGHQRSTIMALGMDPLAAQIRLVAFFDTPALDLNHAGVVVRARRVQGREDDSVVKLRPVVPEELPAQLRALPTFGVEVDAMPGGFVCSASMKGRLGTDDVTRAMKGEKAVRKLFSKEQRAFYEDHAPAGIELDALALLGPIFVLKLNLTPAALRRKLIAEMWLYPDGSRILELSTKCAPKELFQVAAETRAFLHASGVELSGDQQTKTAAALRYFAAKPDA